MKRGGIIFIFENDDEIEQLQKALLHAYKALERRSLENLEEIKK